LPEHFNSEGEITTAVQQAFTLARTALEVLNTQFEHPAVQSMVHHILGNDEKLSEKLARVKSEILIPWCFW
jgi:hypothetical protein